MVVSEIQKVLQDNIPDSEVMVDSNDDTHFQAIVISDSFNKKKSLDRQRMIYAVIGSQITDGSIHALSLQTFTREEWRERCDN